MLNPKGCKLITLSRWNIAKQSGDVRGTSASRWQKKLNSWSSKPVRNCPTKSLQHLAALPNAFFGWGQTSINQLLYKSVHGGVWGMLQWVGSYPLLETVQCKPIYPGLCHGTKAKLQSIPALVAVLSADGVQRFVYTVYTYSQKREKTSAYSLIC